MDLSKLKIDQFNHIKLINFPDTLNPGIDSTNQNPEVIIYYIDQPDDVEQFVKYCETVSLPKENRTIMVFKKGRKDGVNRDAIITPFRNKKYKNFVFKAPMLCSLSKEYSAFTLAKSEVKE